MGTIDQPTFKRKRLLEEIAELIVAAVPDRQSDGVEETGISAGILLAVGALLAEQIPVNE